MPRVGRNQVDQRAMRFAALITAIVLGLALALGPLYGLPLLAIQTFVFALGAIMGLAVSPYVAVYRNHVSGRLGSTPEPGAQGPHRFTQVLGMLFGITAMLSGVLSATFLFYLFTGILFAASALHAATGRCLGCDLYQRLLASVAAVDTSPAADTSVNISDEQHNAQDSHA